MIKCGEKEFKVHKIVLASQSPVFEKTLVTDMREKSGIIDIPDTDPAVEDLLVFIYKGTAPNLSTLARELLLLARMYEMSHLSELCECEMWHV